jgi:hypothetical protein
MDDEYTWLCGTGLWQLFLWWIIHHPHDPGPPIDGDPWMRQVMAASAIRVLADPSMVGEKRAAELSRMASEMLVEAAQGRVA